jgi:serine/threonine protein kinase
MSDTQICSGRVTSRPSTRCLSRGYAWLLSVVRGLFSDAFPTIPSSCINRRTRFLLEAEITGGLEHPGIVPVYGLGAAADGRPYYAMRFIRGESLKEAIDRFHGPDRPKHDSAAWSATLRGLLRRFIDACDAVTYAHSRGVIHRDLKPSNIMLGPYGETLVVDWGLAKPVGRTEAVAGTEEVTLRPPAAGGTTPTQVGSAIGTPAFMSPEQASGHLDRMGPASDVYSLGATLYYLLTGKPPFQAAEAATILERVQQGRFAKPRQVDRHISKPLEAICLKAMALWPEDRHASPRALADDLERWLADEPVSAWREPWYLRARRRLWRHRALVFAGSAALAVGIVALVAILVLQARANERLKDANHQLEQSNEQLVAANRREQAAKDLALARFALAREAVEAFHTGASEDVLLKQPELKALRAKLLGAALQFYRKLQATLEESRDDIPQARSELAGAYASIGSITAEIGSREDAIAAHERARALRESLVRDHPENAAYRRELAASLHSLGVLNRETGRTAAALQSLRDERKLREALVHDHPNIPTYQSDLATGLHELGYLQRELGQPTESLSSYLRALAFRAALARDHPENADYQANLAWNHNSIGNLQRNAGHPAEALRSFGRAREIYAQLVHDHPEVARYRHELAQSENNLGVIHAETSRLAEALTSFQQARAAWEGLTHDHPTVTTYRGHLAYLLGNIGELQVLLDQKTQALESYQQALGHWETLARDHPTVTDYLTGLATSHAQLGGLQRREGRTAEALASLRQALEIWKGLASPTPYDLINAASAYAQCSGLIGSGKPEPTAEERKERQNYAERAVATLNRAMAAGYRDAAWINEDESFEPIRSRADFRMLMLDMAFPDDPFGS